MKYSQDLTTVVGISEDGNLITHRTQKEGKSRQLSTKVFDSTDEKFDKSKDFVDLVGGSVCLTHIKKDGTKQVYIYEVEEGQREFQPPRLARVKDFSED